MPKKKKNKPEEVDAKIRKTKYDTHIKPYLLDIKQMKRSGLSNESICKRLGVSLSTFKKYLREHDELYNIVTFAKQELDMIIEDKLFENAMNGDTIAQMFYLKTRYGYIEEEKRQYIAIKKAELEMNATIKQKELDIRQAELEMKTAEFKLKTAELEHKEETNEALNEFIALLEKPPVDNDSDDILDRIKAAEEEGDDNE